MEKAPVDSLDTRCAKGTKRENICAARRCDTGLPSALVVEQSPRDHLGLNLARAFEDVEDARVREETADRIFRGEAVAAMDLQRIVRRRPRNASGDQLGHAGLEIAALALILAARGEIGE